MPGDGAGERRQSTQLATARYKGGLVAAIEVIDTQRTLLQAQRESLQVSTFQVLTAVALIKALGDGWNKWQLTGQPGTSGIKPE